MPELPEVEVTRLGIDPHIVGRKVSGVVFRRDGLRWPFPRHLESELLGHCVVSTSRRSKYLFIHFEIGTLIVHLGMSGHLRIVETRIEPEKHDHFDLQFGAHALRLTDPRRFGAVLWFDGEPTQLNSHPLLQKLGVEPLSEAFNVRQCHEAMQRHHAAIKQVLLSGDVVVGVGNIYASESLFKAKIHPTRAANNVSKQRLAVLVDAIKLTLAESIKLGGSSLKDFVGADGQKGYFQQTYYVYDRAEEPCRICQTPIRQIKQGQRSTFYCPRCQK